MPGGPAGPAPPVFQAYGPIASFVGGQLALGHGGGSPGASSTLDMFVLDMFVDSDWTVVMLSNYAAGTVQPLACAARRMITAAL